VAPARPGRRLQGPAFRRQWRANAAFIGRTVELAGAHYTGEGLAMLFTKVLGEKVVYRSLTHDQMRAAGFPGADEIGNMYQFYAGASGSFVGNRDISLIRTINPRL
jgi:hypothetical protein